ncbi:MULTISPECIES: hypothetical protein [Streptomyces]|uniref:hypothetical protein n=1 Tax=Streptomyces herbicida TaxID=3065675 RepID=UPI002930C476|nr:hypothetical protein [Streptomyces sp. NEAU-HV9]
MTTTPAAAAGTAPESPDPALGGEPAPPVPEALVTSAPAVHVASAPATPVSPGLRPESRLRLRPGVAVTPLLTGLHLRGRGVAVTLEGSRALPALWQLLADRLSPDRTVRGDGDAPADARVDGDTRTGALADAGGPADACSHYDARSEADARPQDEAGARAEARAPAGTGARDGAGATAAVSGRAEARVQAALATLAARLREHDLVVEHPDGAELPPWPGSSAAHPAEAVDAIRTARPVVATPHPEGPLAVSLVRALRSAGANPRVTADGSLPAGRAVATAEAPSGAVALAVSCDADGGFVTEPGSPNRVRADADALATRLGTGTPASALGMVGGLSPTHVALLAGAAAGRLLAAVMGLPDPAVHEDASGTATAGHPAVLIARAEPPEATYHPWAAAPRGARQGTDAPPAADLGEALRRVTALGDPRLGVLAAPMPGDLPQLPASLTSCRTPQGLLVAGAVRADLARLEAACRAAELALADGSSTPVVGADPDHAHGRALRRAVLDHPGPGATPTASEAEPVAVGARADDIEADIWRTHPQARHWWTVLTERMGRSTDLSVRQLDSEEAYAAVVRVGSASTGTGAAPVTVSRAVEATAADAVALAALDAVTRVMAAQHVPDRARHTAFSGAAAPLAVAGVEPADWVDEGWTDAWLAGIAAREPALRAALRRLTGLRPAPWRGTGHPQLTDALRACGFTVLNGPGGPR